MKLQELKDNAQRHGKTIDLSNAVTDNLGNVLKVSMTEADAKYLLSGYGYMITEADFDDEDAPKLYEPSPRKMETYIAEQLNEVQESLNANEDLHTIASALLSICSSLENLVSMNRAEADARLCDLEEMIENVSRK